MRDVQINSVQPLEPRRLRHGSVTFDEVNGIIMADGTAGKDEIWVSLEVKDFPDFDVTWVVVRMRPAGDELIPYDETPFSEGDVSALWVQGLGEADEIRIDHDLVIPTDLRGGDGNDKIYGGGGPDLIRGGPGEDYIEPAGGEDAVYGEGDNDRIFSFPDEYVDTLNGGAGTDTLVGDWDYGVDTLTSIEQVPPRP